MGEVESISACIDRHVAGVLYRVRKFERSAVLAEDARRHEFAADPDLGHILRGGCHALAQFDRALAMERVERVAAFGGCFRFDASRAEHEVAASDRTSRPACCLRRFARHHLYPYTQRTLVRS